MKLLKSIAAELTGLFVDDWSFALRLLLWVGVCALPSWRSHPKFDAWELFLGLAVMTLSYVGEKATRRK